MAFGKRAQEIKIAEEKKNLVISRKLRDAIAPYEGTLSDIRRVTGEEELEDDR